MFEWAVRLFMGFWPMEEAARRPQPDLQSNLTSAAGPAASFFSFSIETFCCVCLQVAGGVTGPCLLFTKDAEKEREK